jgi:hypothetical protein
MTTSNTALNIDELERSAAAAKAAYSFFDYKAGSATAELNSYLANAQKIAADTVEKLVKANAPAERIEKVSYLLARYTENIGKWLLEGYKIDVRCPSVMITGASNFPVRKKEKQIEAMRKHMNNSPEYLLEQIAAVSHNANTIFSDDKNAVEKIEQRIQQLEESAKSGKIGNAYYKKHGTIKGCPGVDDEKAEEIDEMMKLRPYMMRPFASDNSQEINRLKMRLLELAPEKLTAEKTNLTINGIPATFENIVDVFNTAARTSSEFSDTIRFYVFLPLEFSDGNRKYYECLQIETDEKVENLVHYNCASRTTELVSLDNSRKFELVVSRINGGGNKAVIYRALMLLHPQMTKEDIQRDVEKEYSKKLTINGENIEVKRDEEQMRLMIIFEAIPSQATRDIMKHNGFRWAPSNKAWQRLLNANAESALKRISQEA